LAEEEEEEGEEEAEGGVGTVGPRESGDMGGDTPEAVNDKDAPNSIEDEEVQDHEGDVESAVHSEEPDELQGHQGEDPREGQAETHQDVDQGKKRRRSGSPLDREDAPGSRSSAGNRKANWDKRPAGTGSVERLASRRGRSPEPNARSRSAGGAREAWEPRSSESPSRQQWNGRGREGRSSDTAPAERSRGPPQWTQSRAWERGPHAADKRPRDRDPGGGRQPWPLPGRPGPDWADAPRPRAGGNALPGHERDGGPYGRRQEPRRGPDNGWRDGPRGGHDRGGDPYGQFSRPGGSGPWRGNDGREWRREGRGEEVWAAGAPARGPPEYRRGGGPSEGRHWQEGGDRGRGDKGESASAPRSSPQDDAGPPPLRMPKPSKFSSPPLEPDLPAQSPSPEFRPVVQPTAADTAKRIAHGEAGLAVSQDPVKVTEMPPEKKNKRQGSPGKVRPETVVPPTGAVKVDNEVDKEAEKKRKRALRFGTGPVKKPRLAEDKADAGTSAKHISQSSKGSSPLKKPVTNKPKGGASAEEGDDQEEEEEELFVPRMINITVRLPGNNVVNRHVLAGGQEAEEAAVPTEDMPSPQNTRKTGGGKKNNRKRRGGNKQEQQQQQQQQQGQGQVQRGQPGDGQLQRGKGKRGGGGNRGRNRKGRNRGGK